MTIKDELISILGEDATDPCVFVENLQVEAIYTWKGDIYCLDKGMDFSIDSLEKESQIDILNAIKNKKYIVDETFQ